jgi:hypothetical protein
MVFWRGEFSILVEENFTTPLTEMLITPQHEKQRGKSPASSEEIALFRFLEKKSRRKFSLRGKRRLQKF